MSNRHCSLSTCPLGFAHSGPCRDTSLDIPDTKMHGMKRLTRAEAQQVYEATSYSYESGDYPPSSPQWLLDYCVGDGGLLQALHQLANR